MPESNAELLPGDYYLTEEGLLVFTAEYHLRRGYCCGSGCRHCPWRKEEKDGKEERVGEE